LERKPNRRRQGIQEAQDVKNQGAVSRVGQDGVKSSRRRQGTQEAHELKKHRAVSKVGRDGGEPNKRRRDTQEAHDVQKIRAVSRVGPDEVIPSQQKVSKGSQGNNKKTGTPGTQGRTNVKGITGAADPSLGLELCCSGKVENEVGLQARGCVKVEVGIEGHLTSTSASDNSKRADWWN
jgi:hypothetical protein